MSVCYFCRNGMHGSCSGGMQPDPTRGPPCACSWVNHVTERLPFAVVPLASDRGY